MIEATGYDYSYLRQCASIARRFTEEVRENVLLQSNTNSLSWSHFKEVAPLTDEQAVYWLNRAAEREWGVSRLREEIKRWKGGDS